MGNLTSREPCIPSEKPNNGMPAMSPTTTVQVVCSRKADHPPLELPMCYEKDLDNVWPSDGYLGSPWPVSHPPSELCNPYTPTSCLAALAVAKIKQGSQDVAAPPWAIFEPCTQRVVRASPRPCLEIYWLGGKIGWGVRTLEPINVGEFVCEYTGEILTDDEAELRCGPGSEVGRDAYLFNLTTPRHWRALGAQPLPSPLAAADAKELFVTSDLNSSDVIPNSATDDDPAFVIDAFCRGNIGRFLNHGCGPSTVANVVPLFVYVEQEDGKPVDARLPRVALFANRRIEIGEELRYDYDMQPGEVGEIGGGQRHLACYCGSETCRGWVY
eukprot:TRINITY_DN70903_c0_g1_i1.p1 TRINITY_DN70903_c0_g1~~TRINITY_DN70903_c0_g1_i1.p1  ORF type:complete len:328 (+),score=48.31 TRINITY_DN70903_c0_g1_i1:187-1170(+)